jgi:hypothetical protein
MTGMRSESSVDTQRRLVAAPSTILWALLITLFGIAVILWVRPDPVPSEIRVRNDTGLPLSEVRIDGIGYGDIAAGGVSSYSNDKHAYELASFRVNIQGIPVEAQLDDHVGMAALGPGKFTYVLSLKYPSDIRSVQIHAKRD